MVPFDAIGGVCWNMSMPAEVDSSLLRLARRALEEADGRGFSALSRKDWAVSRIISIRPGTCRKEATKVVDDILRILQE